MNEYKKDFPIFSKHPSLVYLDSAATAHKPKQVIDAMSTFDSESYGTVHRAVYSLAQDASSKYTQARKTVMEFIGAKSTNEIIFTKGSTESINLLAYSFPQAFMKPGDEVLLTEIEHHSNIVPWQIAEKLFGIKIRYISILDSGDIDIDQFKSLLNSKTRLVSIAHISNTLGTLHPIQEIVTLSHSVGAKVFLDAAQSVPHIAIDVQNLDIDFMTFSAHKLYGPTGIGVLYGKENLLDKLPPYQTGGSMVESVSLQETSFAPLPLKFEAGTPMITQSVGLTSAIEYLNSISFSKIHDHETMLLEYALKALSKINKVQLLCSPKVRGSLISFTVKDTHPLDIGTMLNLKNVAIRTGHQCAQTAMKRFNISHVIRISFGIYNDTKDIDIFADSLKAVINKLD